MTQEASLLIVEDEPKIARLMADYLGSHNFAPTIIGHGSDVMPWLTQHSPALVLLDVMLPGKDGLTLCREIRQQWPLLPIIMVTAKVEEVDRLLGLELGADDYICKPFSPREVVARVKAVLRRSQAIAEATGHIACLAVGGKIGLVGDLPAFAEPACKPHSLDDLGVAARGFQLPIARHVFDHGVANRLLGKDIGQNSQGYEQNGAGKGRHTDPEMKQKTYAEIERHPRQIEKGGRPRAGEKTTHIVEIAQRLKPVARHARRDVAAPLGTLPLYLRQGGIVPLLRPTIDTMAPTTPSDTIQLHSTARMKMVSQPARPWAA